MLAEADKHKFDALIVWKTDRIGRNKEEIALKQNLGLTKEHILYFLHQFSNMDYTDLECQKRLIKTFINSVFVYDDKVVLTFNYSGDDRTITLNEIDAGLQQGVRLPPPPPKRNICSNSKTVCLCNLSRQTVLLFFKIILFNYCFYAFFDGFDFIVRNSFVKV